MNAKERMNTWLKAQLKAKASTYTETRKLKIVCCTWNVGEKFPRKDESLYEWLHLKETPDIIVVGLQEVDMTAQAMLKIATEASDNWVKLLDSQVQSTNCEYVRLLARQLVGLFLCVYLKKIHISKVKHLRHSAIGMDN